jgi:hypothetical protein
MQTFVQLESKKCVAYIHKKNRFWTDDVENTPYGVKYKAVGKFAPKVLVWCAISEAGVSTPFIGTVKGQAVDVYITKCDAIMRLNFAKESKES